MVYEAPPLLQAGEELWNFGDAMTGAAWGGNAGSTTPGKLGNCDLNWNTTTADFGGGLGVIAPNWVQDTVGSGTNNYHGIPGIRIPNDGINKRANFFTGSNNYLDGDTTLTLGIWFTEDFVAYGASLNDLFSLVDDTDLSGSFGRITVGYDHNIPEISLASALVLGSSSVGYYRPGLFASDATEESLNSKYPYKRFQSGYQANGPLATGMSDSRMRHTTDGYDWEQSSENVGARTRTMLWLLRIRPHALHGTHPIIYSSKGDMAFDIFQYGNLNDGQSFRGSSQRHFGNANVPQSQGLGSAVIKSYSSSTARSSLMGHYHSMFVYKRWLTDRQCLSLFSNGPFQINRILPS
jgi:hypothetical protein